MSELENHIAQHRYKDAVQLCLDTNQLFLGLFLSKLLPEPSIDFGLHIGKIERPITVKLLCNWCSPEQLAHTWNKMSKGNFTWNNIRLVWGDTADYYVVVNAPPPGVVFDRKKTIVFRMEPNMSANSGWKEWSNPDDRDFLRVLRHENGDHNNTEWHLSKTYTELSSMAIEKDPRLDTTLSTVLSNKYRDPGHIRRIDFVKFLESKNVNVHVFGGNKWEYKNYLGPLPYHNKDQAILPYKYTFNAENHDIPHYFTEKLVDGILGECLTFYYGCFNVREYFDPRAFVQLDLTNAEDDCNTIVRAMKEDWHTQRLPYIREAKKKILNCYQFFPRLERILNEVSDKQDGQDGQDRPVGVSNVV